MICPNCKAGFITGFGCPGFKPLRFPCHYCHATGKLSPEWDYDPKRGARIRQTRLHEQKTLREMAVERGVSAVTVSDEERGYFRRADGQETNQG